MRHAILWLVGIVAICCTTLYLCGVPLWDIFRILLVGVIGMIISFGVLLLPALFDDFTM